MKTPGCCENIRYFPDGNCSEGSNDQTEFAYVRYVHHHSLTLGSEIRKFRAVNSSLSAGIPVLVKLLCLMESCNVYSHYCRKSFCVFTNISRFCIACPCCAVLSVTSEISAEKSSAAHRRTASNVPNVLAAILLQNLGTRSELQCSCRSRLELGIVT